MPSSPSAAKPADYAPATTTRSPAACRTPSSPALPAPSAWTSSVHPATNTAETRGRSSRAPECGIAYTLSPILWRSRCLGAGQSAVPGWRAAQRARPPTGPTAPHHTQKGQTVTERMRSVMNDPSFAYGHVYQPVDVLEQCVMMLQTRLAKQQPESLTLEYLDRQY